MTDVIKKLYLFNLATDLDDPLLAFTHDWITCSSRIAQKVEVISTHVGRYNLPSNVRVRELGGGSLSKRVSAVFFLLKIGVEIYSDRKNSKVFYHMTNRVAAILSLPIRTIGVKQAIWYSHSSKPISLILASNFCDLIFSSALSSLPINKKKCRYIGHGVDFSNFPKISDNNNQARSGFVSLGRVAPIKKLEIFIDAVARCSSVDKSIDLIGPTQSNKDYQEFLIGFASKRNVNLRFLGQINYREVPQALINYSICYTGNPRTTDKAAIEAAAVGCFVVATEIDTQSLTGMTEIWQHFNVNQADLVSQINKLLTLEKDFEWRKDVSQRAIIQNSVDKTVAKILWGLVND